MLLLLSATAAAAAAAAAPQYTHLDYAAPSLGPGPDGAPLLVDTRAHWEPGFEPGRRAKGVARMKAFPGEERKV